MKLYSFPYKTNCVYFTAINEAFGTFTYFSALERRDMRQSYPISVMFGPPSPQIFGLVRGGKHVGH